MANRAAEKLPPSDGIRNRTNKATAASADASKKNSGQNSSNLGCLLFIWF